MSIQVHHKNKQKKRWQFQRLLATFHPRSSIHKISTQAIEHDKNHSIPHTRMTIMTALEVSVPRNKTSHMSCEFRSAWECRDIASHSIASCGSPGPQRSTRGGPPDSRSESLCGGRSPGGICYILFIDGEVEVEREE